MGLWSSQRQNLLSNIINRYFYREIALVSVYWLDHKHVFYANFQFPLVFRTCV